jgi:hypothetical protein
VVAVKMAFERDYDLPARHRARFESRTRSFRFQTL